MAAVLVVCQGVLPALPVMGAPLIPKISLGGVDGFGIDFLGDGGCSGCGDSGDGGGSIGGGGADGTGGALGGFLLAVQQLIT